jgi:hypothetical protein
MDVNRPTTSRPMAAFMTVAMGLFTAVFVVIGGAAIIGRMPRVPWVMGVVFIGVAAIGVRFLMYFLPLALTGREPDVDRRPEKVVQQGSGTARTTTYQRRGNVTLTILGYAGLAVFIGAFLLLSLALLPFLPIALIMAVIVIPSAIAGIRQLLDNPAALELSTAGLAIPAHGFIAWPDVERLAIEDLYPVMSGEENTRVIGSTRQLGVYVRPGVSVGQRGALEGYTRGLGRLFTSLAAAAGRGKYASIAVAERELPVPLEEILEAAEAYRREAIGAA